MTTYTEDEFKLVLKNLFAEKKRVKELQKQLDEKGIQKKFHAKLVDFQKFSLPEEYAKLKAVYAEKEQECARYKQQFEKIRPALRRLVDEIKGLKEKAEALEGERARLIDEIVHLKSDLSSKEEEHEAVLELGYKKMRALSTQLNEESDAEIRKAQHHLAKKVKEATILRDLVERQKIELAELRSALEKRVGAE